ncbi:MAG TPA: 2'-5' RNA ligase family protein [Acidimicrobiales bacterium]|nr:2'-5' RNA ligase family protein [Acidimicrobiales bacterium]
MDIGGGAHATLFLPPDVAAPLDQIRRVFDPAFAAQIGLHATLTYPDETPHPGLLAQRLDELGEWSGPIPLLLTEVVPYGEPPDPRRGLQVRTDDVSGAYLGARAQLLAPPCTPHGVDEAVPHITLVHPITSQRGPEAWAALAGRRIDTEVTIERVALVAWDGAGWPSSKVVRLTGGPW